MKMMGCGAGALGAPPLGCSALSAEQEQIEWNGEDSNDLCGIILPLLGYDLPLIYRGRSGT